ncbi:MAG TPA: SdpA family antimicrobial peptide system protein [Mycobacterium sp.]
MLLSVYVQQSVLRSPFTNAAKQTITSLMPQGWAFFTKSPRLAYATPYLATTGGYEQVEPRSGVFADTRRDDRNFVIELEMLDRALAEVELIACDSGDAQQCFDELPLTPSANLTSPLVDPTACGDVFVAMDKVAPWAWRGLTEKTLRTEHVALVSVSC